MSAATKSLPIPVATCSRVTGLNLANFPLANLRKRTSKLVDIMAYSNDAVVARFQKEFNLSEEAANQLLDDVKQFLWLSSVVKGPIAPPPIVDDGWHVLIIFTEDYSAFCDRYFGRFLHHRPRRPDDLPDGGAAARRTIHAVQIHFGGVENLSPNWMFPGMTTADCFGGSCSSDSVSCSPSTNCHS